MPIRKDILNDILTTLAEAGPEHGCVLGCDKSGIICASYFDRTGLSNERGYKPDTVAINRIIIEKWLPNDIYMIGIAHRHGDNNRVLSCFDVDYGIKIIRALKYTDVFYLPVITVSDDIPVINVFAISRNAEKDINVKMISIDIV